MPCDPGRDDNGSDRGANATTRDIAARRQARSVPPGWRPASLRVNTYRSFHPLAPFGGMKPSGFGKENGFDSVAMYARQKAVVGISRQNASCLTATK
ncbi:aldehyde dehydrogenase family protein [Arthrobacter sp. FW305-BF8]|uniref:aldehyde dehydrogenase family protein n=1 Tax=Arthrobacter sp. FW305-BF8 TaxID=2879617 RepID=UPI001F462684|nr:aldehyde dehydrogenase family protein [Arthrobacter sp. FW305-BF8]UKA55237.1 aldehyde dehydrogenase family protein [Arthrobacter sp. FW305-BF8]